MKRQSEYTPAEWANLYPEQRYAAMQAEADASLGRSDRIPVRADDGRSVVYVDPRTGQPAPAAPQRRIGGSV